MVNRIDGRESDFNGLEVVKDAPKDAVDDEDVPEGRKELDMWAGREWRPLKQSVAS